jgi:hypothetical protein
MRSTWFAVVSILIPVGAACAPSRSTAAAGAAFGSSSSVPGIAHARPLPLGEFLSSHGVVTAAAAIAAEARLQAASLTARPDAVEEILGIWTDHGWR